MQPSRIRRIIVIASIVSLFVSYLGIWFRMINDPIQRTGSDFIAFYSAGRITQTEGPANAYNPSLQQQIQQEQVGFTLVPGQVLLYNHLPFLLPILEALINTNYVQSFYRWILLLLTLYLASLAVLSYVLIQAGVNQSSTLLTAAASFLFLPLFFSLMNGQDTAFLFLGTAIWVYGLVSGREIVSGLGLSLTTVRPQIALFLAIPMLFRHIKVFAGFVLGSGILVVLSVCILGVGGTREFIKILLLSTRGAWYGIKENAMYNLIGLLTRIIPQLGAGTIRSVGWIAYGMSIISLCVFWLKARNLDHGLIGLTVILALFVAPHLHFHDLALLLIPIYEIIRTSIKAGMPNLWLVIIAPVTLSLLLLISNISPYLQYTVPYLIMLALVVYPYSRFRTAITTPHQS